MTTPPGWRPAVPLLVCAVLAVIHTWPLATAPHVFARHDNGDVLLNEWIIAWVQHQLPRDPLDLFQANIFFPARDTLAYSEPLIVPALMTAPVRWLGGSPVLVHNVLIVAGLALTAFAAYLAAYAWTGDRIASFVAASAFAFNTHLLTRLAHVQGLQAYGLPLALLAADRLLVHARTGDALWLALWMIVMAYTSGHLPIFATVMVVVAVLARPADWVRRPVLVLSRFGLAALVAALAVLPLYLPYRRVAIEQGLVRRLEHVGEYSATVEGYLASAGRLHLALWSEPLFRGPIEAFFPGVLVILLAASLLLARWRRGQSGVRPGSDQGQTLDAPDAAHRLPTRRIVMLVAIGAAGFVLSLGTNTPVYGWLYAVFPPLSAIRAAARFGNLFLLAMALLAAIGLARLRAAGLGGRRGATISILLVALVNAEALRAPFQFGRFDGIPNVYSIVAAEPGRVVLVEQPFYSPQAIFENAEYVFNSTAHWRPLMNGYSGFVPSSYARLAEAFAPFPAAGAIEAMRREGATHLMYHPRRFHRDREEMQRAVDASPLLERVAVGRNGVTLYRIKQD